MKRELKQDLIDCIAIGLIVLEFFLCWISKRAQLLFMPYTTLISFISLVILFLNHINLANCIRKKDYELYLVVIATVWAGINMIIVRSNKGAIFTIMDFLLLLYLANKVKLSKNSLNFIIGISVTLAIFWLFIKRPIYSDRDQFLNPNAIACIIYSLSTIGFCGCLYRMEKRLVSKKLWKIMFGLLSLILFIQSLLLKARGVMAGVALMGLIVYIQPKKKIHVFAIALVSLLFPVVYIWIWKAGIDFKIPFTNKYLISGRERIWLPFFEAFIKHPITGIGSDLERMVHGTISYEVHHALLDILFIHGIPVFIITFFLLIKRLFGILEYKESFIGRISLAVICGMIVIGTFENYYITSPYNMSFFMILLICNQYRSE